MAAPTFIEPEVVLGTTTSWLPVTTVYPSVAGCASAFFWFPGQPGPAGWDPGYGYFAGGTLRCHPPQVTSWWELPHQNPDGYTSLSIQPLVCPAAFSTAVTEIRSVSSTLVMCCPSGYTIQGGQPGRAVGVCMSPLTSGQILTYTAQAGNLSWFSSTLVARSASTVSAVAILGWNVARAATSTPTVAATSAASPTSTSTADSQSRHELSTGAKAGIGVGIAVAVVALMVLLGLFICKQRRRKYRSHSTVEEVVQLPAAEPKPVYEMPYNKRPPYEMYQHPAELESPYSRIPNQLR